MTESFLKPIRSFVTRKGRMSPNYTLAIEKHGPDFILTVPEHKSPYDWEKVFGRCAPTILEIGFGMGDNLLKMAKSHPENNYIGIEVHQPGIGRVISQAFKEQISNLKLFACDAVVVFECAIAQHSLDEVMVLFPDPWPKTKHHKRRLVQTAFVDCIAQKLKSQGKLLMATDWQDYAEQMCATLDDSPHFANLYGRGNFAPQSRAIITKFEARGQRLGHQIYDLVYRRI